MIFLPISSADPPFTFWGHTEQNRIPTCGSISHIWEMYFLYSTICRWHGLVTRLSSTLLQFSCLFIMEWHEGRRVTFYILQLTSAEESPTIPFQLEVKQFWQLPICLIGLNRASYFSNRTTGFLSHPGTGRMLLDWDGFTLIIWLSFRHSLVPTIWPCDCGAWMGGEWCRMGRWMTNMGGIWKA